MSSLFGGGEKEARRQEDIARQTSEIQAMGNQFLSQLVPGSEEYNRYASFLQQMVSRASEGAFAVAELGGSVLDQQEAVRQFGEQIVRQQGERIAGGGPATPLEARTDLAFGGLREAAALTPEEQAIFNALRGTEQPGGEGAALTDVFGQLVQRARTPEQFFESTFAPELQLLQEQVKSRAASRGILGSGLELENLGRAGVELAIRQAQQKEAFRQNQLQNLFGLFDVGQGLRGRQIGLEEALLNLQQGRESRLTDLLGRESSLRTSDIRDLLGQNLQTTTARVNVLPTDWEKFQRGTELVQGGLFGGGGQPRDTDVSSLLAAGQQPGVTGLQTQGGVTSLSRQADTDGDDWQKYLQMAMQAAQLAAMFAA